MQTESKYELDDSFWPRWIKVVALIPVLLFFGYLAAHMYAWRLRGQPMRIGSIYLHNLHRKWIADGSPTSPVVTNYVGSAGGDRYFVWTNTYVLAGTNFESRFGFEAQFFLERGFLVISRDGRVAWIDKKTGPELLKP